MAKRIIELKKELESLLKEEKDYQFIKDFRYHTVKEFELFKKANIKSFERLKFIKSKIREIQWELMTDEDKIAHLQYLKDLKGKFKD